MKTFSRRSFLAMGSALACAPLAAFSPSRTVTSVIWLWMEGGMCQGHTWDPKPGARPGCPVGAIDTAVPGIQISEFLPVCASQMRHLTLIRSISHGFAHPDLATRHLYGVDAMGPTLESPSVGTILSHELMRPGLALPLNLSMGGPSLPESRVFGDACCPFLLGPNWTDRIPNVRRNVDAARDQDRASLLLEQNRDWDAKRLQATIERSESAALKSEQLMSTPALKVFNLGEESPEIRKEYGEGFGQNCLTARRLVQAGCPFIEIGLTGWSRGSHGKLLLPVLDQGLGTLLKDLAERGLLSSTLVVCATPFGKPSHFRQSYWTEGFSVALAGGYLRGGVVLGDTGKDGTQCDSPVEVKDLLATIYAACGVDWEKSYTAESGRKYTYTRSAKPLDELF